MVSIYYQHFTTMTKAFNHMTLLCLFAGMVFILPACSDDEQSPNPAAGLEKIASGYALGAGARVDLYADESLFAGYNRVFAALSDSVTGKPITESHIHFLPEMTMASMSHGCPVENPESEKAVDGLFPGSILFTMPSGDAGSWKLQIDVHNHVNGLPGTAKFDIVVAPTSPSKVLSFKTLTEQRFYLSYYFPKKMKVGVNDFEMIAFTLESGEFVPAEDLAFVLTPEMPSMGHGSPNNVNPVHTIGSHYAGKVNFTMTGEWRLNLAILKGGETIAEKFFDIEVHE